MPDPPTSSGSVALLLVFAVPSYAMAHDDGNDMEVACVWDWASRGSFVSVMLLLLSLFAWNGRLAVYEAVLLLLMSVVCLHFGPASISEAS